MRTDRSAAVSCLYPFPLLRLADVEIALIGIDQLDGLPIAVAPCQRLAREEWIVEHRPAKARTRIRKRQVIVVERLDAVVLHYWIISARSLRISPRSSA